MNPDYEPGLYNEGNPYSYAGPSASMTGMDGGSGEAAASGGGMGAAGTGLAIGAGLGILSAIGQQNAYQAKMKQMATTTRFSPWTKMSMAQPDVPNALGTITGLGASGAATGQGVSGGSMLPMALMMGGA